MQQPLPGRLTDPPPLVRLLVAAVLGALVGLAPMWQTLVGALLGTWATTGAVYSVWTLAVTMPMGPDLTASHATREEPTRFGAHLVVLVAALASLAGVVVVLTRHNQPATLVATLAAVAVSWTTLHTTSALRYARLYYTAPVGGIDFHQSAPPRYTDFAYVAFTVGMSFAISDTDLASSRMRAHALVHALLSYLFGTVIVALLVNLIAGLGG
ncbi:MAG: DUF1345 domain-containing protein [Cellulomonas sp.]|nr:DUF1345 domain-containing protein [Cellulomonas sp.]